MTAVEALLTAGPWGRDWLNIDTSGIAASEKRTFVPSEGCSERCCGEAFIGVFGATGEWS